MSTSSPDPPPDPAADSPRDPLVGRVLAGRFEIERRISEGGYSVVYQANQIGLDRKVAIKVLAANAVADPFWVDRFRRTARALARVDHPNTVRTLELGSSPDGYEFLVMELLPGRTLRAELDAEGALAPARALDLVSQAARGLSAIHECGMIHRDLKPSSLLLTHVGERELVKLLFSIVLRTSDPDAPKTPANRALGAPLYLAPEVLRGEPPAPAADLYALGVILYELCAGYRPFEGATAVDVAIAHVKAAPRPLPDSTPGLLAAIIEQALAKQPAARFPSAAALADTCATAARYLA